MRFRKKQKDLTPEELYEKEISKEARKEKAKAIIKNITKGAAIVAGGITAAGLAVIAIGLGSNKDDEEEIESEYDPNAFDRYYEPFADPDNPLHLDFGENQGDIDWDDFDDDSDYDESDESYGAEDYYSSRPWTDE